MARIHGNKTVFGIVNVAAYNNNPEGDRTWYVSREARNEALASLRATWVRNGLTASAARSGIYAVKNRFSALDFGRDVEISEHGELCA